MVGVMNYLADKLDIMEKLALEDERKQKIRDLAAEMVKLEVFEAGKPKETPDIKKSRQERAAMARKMVEAEERELKKEEIMEAKRKEIKAMEAAGEEPYPETATSKGIRQVREMREAEEEKAEVFDMAEAREKKVAKQPKKKKSFWQRWFGKKAA